MNQNDNNNNISRLIKLKKRLIRLNKRKSKTKINYMLYMRHI